MNNLPDDDFDNIEPIPSDNESEDGNELSDDENFDSNTRTENISTNKKSMKKDQR